MADLLKDFEAYFASKDLIGDWTLFTDTILDDPDSAIALYEYAGQVGAPQVAGALRSVQVVSRANKVTDAKSKAWALFNSLVTEDGILNVTTERWSMIHLRQTPFKLKVDSRGRTYYAFNLGATTYLD